MTILSFSYVICLIYIVAGRIGYKYELQWMEGSILENVNRLIAGKPLYTATSLEFVSYLYMPGFYFVSAIFSKIFGLGFFTIRLVSFLSIAGCMGIIYLFIFKETHNKTAAFSGVGLFCASYNICQGYFDIGRIDMLFVLFLIMGMYALSYQNSLIGMLISSFCFAAAFFTKQTAFIVVIILLVYMFAFKRKYRVLFLGIFACISIFGCYLLNIVSDGWFYYYTFDLPSKHLLDLRGFPAFLGLSSFYFACFVSLLLSRKMRIKNNYYYIAMLASVAVLTSAAMINPLFDFNLFIPMVAVFAVIFGIGYDTVLSKKEELPVLKGRNVFWKRNEFLYSVFIAQLVFMIYNPFKYIPTDADTKAGNELVNIISELPGRVYIPSHPYLCDMAGKEKFAHILPLHDLLELKREGFETDVEKQAKQVFREAVTSQYFDYIILDNSNRLGFLQKEIENYYYRKYLLFEHEENVFWTSTGAKRRPEYIYAKKESALQQ